MRHYLFRGLAGPFSPAYACVSEQVASAVLRSQLPTKTGALFGDRRLEGGRDGGRPTVAGDRQTRCGSGRGRHGGGSSAPWLGAVLRHRFAITYRHIPSSVCLSVCQMSIAFLPAARDGGGANSELFGVRDLMSTVGVQYVATCSCVGE